MQDEQMDNMDELIREASNSHHPAYDDKAWEKMEALLDKHLPVKKDKRRPVIFFLLLLFITGAALFTTLYLPLHKKGRSEATTKLPQTQRHLNNQPTHASIVINPPMIPLDKAVNGLGEDFTKQDLKKPAPTNVGGNNGNPIKTGGRADNFLKEKSDGVINDGDAPENNDQLAGCIKDPMTTLDKGKGKSTNQPAATGTPILETDTAILKAVAVATKDPSKTKNPNPVAGKSPSKPVSKKGFANNFAINLSAGPDGGFVALSNANKARLNYGAGLSYTFAGRITVKSGFYIARKTYSAKAADYHPPAGYWTNNADLKNIYADCNIYELPIAASYNFKQSNDHNWFAGIGFSTFLMKRETYEYYYKDAWGQAMNKTWTLKNGGNQYFSVLTISGGYQYQINSKFSLSAEPYLKLPLQGIGFGKIKLNSGGLLFTASVKPFAKGK